MYLSTQQLDFVSAAARHLNDAERLVNASPDQAFHLAGFAPECAQKAVLTSRWLDKALGHLNDPIGEQALEFALSVEPSAARYRLRLKGPALPVLARWGVECRYERTGTRASEAPQAVSEAEALVDSIASALFMDGRIPPDFEW